MDPVPGEQLSRFVIAVGGAAGVAVLFYPALRARAQTPAAILVVSCGAILATPVLVLPPGRLLRCVAAVWAVTLVAKLTDAHLGAKRGHQPRLGEFLAFLPNIFSLVLRRLDHEPRLSRLESIRLAATGAVMWVPTSVLFIALFRVNWARYGFAAEHTTKVIVFFLALVPLTQFALAIWAFAGGQGLAFMDNPFAARTPADFWRRYNRPVNQFLWENVFGPVGGRRSPVRGAAAVFVVSAVVHEYVFSMAVGRVQGYQTAFFMIQGIAVAATLRAKPRGGAAVASVAATFAFNVASGVLFFASVNSVIPFYENEVPLWDERRVPFDFHGD